MILNGNLFWGKCNSVLGMQFRTCENFQASTDSSLVESPKIFTNTKATPQFLEFASEAKQPSLPLRFCDSQNLGENLNQKPIKSFCYFLLLQKVESLLPLNFIHHANHNNDK